MVDTHMHLTIEPSTLDPEGIWQRAQEAGVTNAICVGTSLPMSEKGITLSHKLPGIHPSVGIHPEEITDTISWQSWEEGLSTLAANPAVVAIGECGLDYAIVQDLEDQPATVHKNQQKRLFGIHIQLAKKLHKPMIIHTRNTKRPTDPPRPGFDVYHDTFDTLRHFSTADGEIPLFVLHCMSGTREYLDRGLQLGGYISFAGNITYPSAQNLRDLLAITPLDRLLLETDAPFLPPQSKRGTPNESAYIAETYAYVANLKQISVSELESIVEQNAKQLFGLK